MFHDACLTGGVQKVKAKTMLDALENRGVEIEIESLVQSAKDGAGKTRDLESRDGRPQYIYHLN